MGKQNQFNLKEVTINYHLEQDNDKYSLILKRYTFSHPSCLPGPSCTTSFPTAVQKQQQMGVAVTPSLCYVSASCFSSTCHAFHGRQTSMNFCKWHGSLLQLVILPETDHSITGLPQSYSLLQVPFGPPAWGPPQAADGIFLLFSEGCKGSACRLIKG